ncbi:MAG TPA: RHS repeat-associated core domain-containing protein [Terriglobales bacterium]|nr:RHS repeat-associated core domain-containing protein [Terriglobales bacterium]
MGCDYNRARYYNNTTGRFWTMDSVEGNPREPLSLHKYLYVASNAPNALDPRGHDYDLGSLASVGAAITTLANTSYVVLANVVGATYVTLYEAPQIIETANNYLTVGLGAFEALRFLGSNVLNCAEGYSRGPIIRGNQFEEAAGANLGRTFPAIDYYDASTGAAVQIRSTTQTQSPEALLGVVRNGVNRLNTLPETLSGVDRAGNPITIEAADVKGKGVVYWNSC